MKMKACNKKRISCDLQQLDCVVIAVCIHYGHAKDFLHAE